MTSDNDIYRGVVMGKDGEALMPTNMKTARDIAARGDVYQMWNRIFDQTLSNEPLPTDIKNYLGAVAFLLLMLDKPGTALGIDSKNPKCRGRGTKASKFKQSRSDDFLIHHFEWYVRIHGCSLQDGYEKMASAYSSTTESMERRIRKAQQRLVQKISKSSKEP